MKKLKLVLAAVFTLVSVVTALPVAVHADTTPVNPTQQIGQGVIDAGGKGQQPLNVRIQGVVNVFMFVLGAVAVIMIIIGGFRYVTSGGDSGSITAAKNTILYAVIGLIVAILAYAIVSFVATTIK